MSEHDDFRDTIGNSCGMYGHERKPPVAGASAGSAFESWITEQDDIVDWDVITPTDQMKMAWNAAMKAAAKQCKEYAHSGANVYRRQVAYACQRRIEALVETPNDQAQRPGPRDA